MHVPRITALVITALASSVVAAPAPVTDLTAATETHQLVARGFGCPIDSSCHKHVRYTIGSNVLPLVPDHLTRR